MAEFLMPSLGADMEAGTLVEWRKKPGERVSRGDIIAEVETEKGIIEVEVFTNGVVERWLVQPETKVPVGTPLAIIREDTAPPVQQAQIAPARPSAHPEASPAAVAPPISAPVRESARVSPAARRRASELGVDPTKLNGTGPDGAVTLDDVERAVAEAPPSPAGISADARSRMRHAIASAMARSKREVPHYYVSHTVDVTPLLEWIEGFNSRASVQDRIIPGVAFLKSVALALRDFPAFNGFWIDGRAVPSRGVHVGAAIALRGGGLVAPAIRDTDTMRLSELMNAFRDLVGRARSGSLKSSEMSDPTITVTSLGDRGTESVIGVIYPPQLAIVGFGRVVERPWVVEHSVVARSVVHLSLAADHRATDGHEGALFLARVADNLTNPEQL
jgi:pyruvate dehydrogenase E2 component (dihydrolipoamide acetyltransferase)